MPAYSMTELCDACLSLKLGSPPRPQPPSMDPEDTPEDMPPPRPYVGPTAVPSFPPPKSRSCSPPRPPRPLEPPPRFTSDSPPQLKVVNIINILNILIVAPRTSHHEDMTAPPPPPPPEMPPRTAPPPPPRPSYVAEQTENMQGGRPSPIPTARQFALFHESMTKANLSSYSGYRGYWLYTSKFGEITENAPFGENLWQGLTDIFVQYRYNYNMNGEKRYGWFVAPASFSKKASETPRGPSDHIFYPCVVTVVFFQGQVWFLMACLHILLISSKPWYIHCSRFIDARDLLIV